MPRGNQLQKTQTAKALIVGDGKCGKTHWAAMAAKAGFNVLYLDGDVAAQTIAGLPPAVQERIFVLSIHDVMDRGKMGWEMVDFIKEFFLARRPLMWNDSQSRLWSRLKDGDSTTDQIWEISPWNLDKNWVVVLDSWTSLSYSAMKWGAAEIGINLEEIDTEDRQKMRGLYQVAGEKLTVYLDIIRSGVFNWIVVSHPNEFTKMEKPTGVTVRAAKEGDMKILWTKMVPKSITNNHAFSMPKYFTDIGWLEVNAMGEYIVDFRPSPERLSGSHLAIRGKADVECSFESMMKKIGGWIPASPAPWENVIKIHDGYQVGAASPAPKTETVLKPAEAGPAIQKKGMSFAAMAAKKG